MSLRTLPPVRLPAALAWLSALALLPGCGGGPVGAACGFTTDCPSGQSCWTRLDPQISFPDGLCSLTCERVGAQDRCPSGSVCAQTGGRLLCAQSCGGPDECREGYACAPAEQEADPAGAATACVHRP